MKRHILIIFLFLFLFSPKASYAAKFFLSPAVGTYSIGSTFSVSILLDTEGQSVNALDVALSFPPDKLQIVSPSTGKSIIGVWTDTPRLDNTMGRVHLQGGIPGGITASNALVSTVTFRVKSVGEAVVKYLDTSKALLNDGRGTNALNETENAVYKFRLPPPAGPIVTSETNPDQDTWYATKTSILKFTTDNIGGDEFSYILSDDPTTIPDDISEGKKNSVSYTNLADGVHYFHIKSLRNGAWGGTTHFALKTDTTPPADFNIEIAPSSNTSSHNPIIQFTTTDALAGIDHYELKLVPLSITGAGDDSSRFFIEAVSPYTPSSLELGSYDVILRAYDKSNNYREVTERLRIMNPFFSFIGSIGISIGKFIIPWLMVWFLALLILGFLIYYAYHIKIWRYQIHKAHEDQELPGSVVAQLEELQKYRERYGMKALVMVLLISSLLMSFGRVHAEMEIAPPLITTISKNVSNEEIFYVGGKTDFADERVVIYIQNLGTGETFSQEIISDHKGEWFYRHTNFLSPGNYLLWAQGQIGEELSPPGPQVKMTVNRTAVQFGGGRLSYETIYLFIIILLTIAIAGLLAYILYHYYHGRKKHLELARDVQKAEESIKRGFAVLRRDIEAELAVIKQAKLNVELSAEERIKEAQLMSDLENIEKHIGHEIWEVRRGVS